jgi:hypothetical protein
MTGADQLFWSEVSDAKATRRSLQICYALLIAVNAGSGAEVWKPINEAVNDKLGLEGMRKVDAFRKGAWEIHDAAARHGR